MKNTSRFCLILTFLFLINACSRHLSKHHTDNNSQHKKAKNVILLIGDGMGPQQIGLLLSYAREASSPVIKNRQTAFDRMLKNNGELGLSMTYAHDTLVTDSAASATQIASGQFAGSEMIGADKNGDAIHSIVDVAQNMNKSTGLVSDVTITHATPAGFGAHQMHRTMEKDIAIDLINSNIDVLFSGGLSNFIPQSTNQQGSQANALITKMVGSSYQGIYSTRSDERNLLVEAKQKGYELLFDKTQLSKADNKALGLFANFPMASGIDVTHNRNKQQPTLKQMSQKAIELLSKNDEGFFLMIESGQIDWAAHANDTGMLLHEMIKMNETLEFVLDWAHQDEETLVIVTADHETGGFGFSYSANDLPKAQPLNGNVFNGSDFKPSFNFGKPEILDSIYQQQHTYRSIFGLFDEQIKNAKNKDDIKKHAPTLTAIINENTAFHITDQQAQRILTKEYNPYLTPNHRYLGDEWVPRMDVNDAFFVYQKDNRGNLLAIEVATQQNVVWATGTHTSTPVLVFAHGPGQSTFGKIMHHTDLHSLIKSAWSELE